MKIRHKKIYIMVPHPSLHGGVGHFYKVARPYFSENIDYVHVNSSATQPLIKLIMDTATLLRNGSKIILNNPYTIVVNPSLSLSAILRDGLIILLATLLRKRTIVFWRGWNPQKEYVLEKRWIKLLLNLSFLRANIHIVLNTYIKNKLNEKGVPDHQITFSNTIVDDSYFTADIATPKEKQILLFLTRVEKYKGIYETLNILKELRKHQNIELHIVGTGSELPRVKAEVEKTRLSNVRFLGYLTGDEKLKALKEADLYIFPSYSEGMPNSVLEAMACGLPIVCTNVGALADFFVDEAMGYSYNLPIDVDKFVRACETILSDENKKNKIREFNKKYAAKRFKASHTARQLEEIFNG